MTATITNFNDDALIDAYREGYDAHRNGNSLPYDDGLLAEAWWCGKKDAQRNSRVRVVLLARPEGYYHSPAGSPDAWRG